MLTYAELAGLIIDCSICNKKYDPKIPSARPYVLNCGHTFCFQCSAINPLNCLVCKQGIKFSKVNFELENQIEAIQKKCQKDPTEEKLNNLKSMYLCRDCNTIYQHNLNDLMEILHEGHNKILLDNLARDKLKETIWLIDLVNKGPALLLEKYNKLLQLNLMVAKEMQTNLEIVNKLLQTAPNLLDTSLMELNQEIPDSKKWEAQWEPRYDRMLETKSFPKLLLTAADKQTLSKPLLTALHKLRHIQSAISSQILKVAHQCCSQLNQFKLSEEIEKSEYRVLHQNYENLIASFCKDEQSGMCMVPGKFQLQHLPGRSYEVSNYNANMQLNDPHSYLKKRPTF